MCNPGASITDPMDSPNHTFHPLFIPFYPSIPSHCHLIPTFPPSIPFFPPSHLTFFFSLLFLSCSSLVKINSTICNAFSVILHCIYATTALYIGEKCFSGITFCPQLQRFLTRSLRQQVCLQTLLVQYVSHSRCSQVKTLPKCTIYSVQVQRQYMSAYFPMKCTG